MRSKAATVPNSSPANEATIPFKAKPLCSYNRGPYHQSLDGCLEALAMDNLSDFAEGIEFVTYTAFSQLKHHLSLKSTHKSQQRSDMRN